jgi:hypothetical protein
MLINVYLMQTVDSTAVVAVRECPRQTVSRVTPAGGIQNEKDQYDSYARSCGCS